MFDYKRTICFLQCAFISLFGRYVILTTESLLPVVMNGHADMFAWLIACRNKFSNKTIFEKRKNIK